MEDALLSQLIGFLRVSVVAIEHGDSKGTGFFVAPNTVLTCAHVLEQSSAPIKVHWHGEAKTATANRVGNEDTLDLAVLSVEPGWKHPSVLLGTDTALDAPFYAFGHPDGIYREGGDSATFIYEGPAYPAPNSELYKFKAGEAAAGLSGAPMLNQRLGTVCSVVSINRRRNTDLGARGVPIAVLRDFFPSLLTRNKEAHADTQWKACLSDQIALLSTPAPSIGRRQNLDTTLKETESRTRSIEVQNATEARTRRHESDVSKYGFYAEELSIEKIMNNDGSSVVHYQVTNLVTERDTLTGLRFVFESDAGCVSFPKLDASTREQLFSWKSQSEPRTKFLPLTAKLESVRKLAGVIEFGEPLKQGDPPVSFGWSVKLLNGAALSDWEFEHLYPGDRRKHLNKVDLTSAIEYYARVVWFPTRSFSIRLVLPDRITTAPRLSVFKCGDKVSVPVDEVVRQGIVQSHLGNESEWVKANVKWQRDRLAEVSDAPGLIKQGPGDYLFSTELANVGWSYSLDWLLPRQEFDGGFENLINLSKEVRQRLIEYAGHAQANGSDDAQSQTSQVSAAESEARNQEIHQLFAVFDREMREEYQRNNGERFSVALMTYDTTTHHLVTIDGYTDGKRFDNEQRKFWLPFGLGLGGACFRIGDHAMGYVKPGHQSEEDPDYYLAVTETLPNEVLIAIAVDHPKYGGFATTVAKSERCRQIIAIVTLSSTKVTNELSKLRPGENGKIHPAATQLFDKIRSRCQTLGRDLTTLVQPEY